MAGKYEPLRRFLASLDGNQWSATFTDVERVLEGSLPRSARRDRTWWGNTRNRQRVQARLGWLAAGWKVRHVDPAGETVVFARVGGTPRKRYVRSDTTPISTKNNIGQSPLEKDSDAIDLLGFDFIHAATIEPEREPDGALREFMPQSRYAHADTTPLNRFGQGPFCRFDVRGLPPTSGVYAITVDDALAYVGIAVDLARRWGPMGYARISPKNCFVGGQSTNCKVNHHIMLAVRDGRRVDLWIHERSDPAPIEASLIRRLDPPWNGHRP